MSNARCVPVACLYVRAASVTWAWVLVRPARKGSASVTGKAYASLYVAEAGEPLAPVTARTWDLDCLTFFVTHGLLLG